MNTTITQTKKSLEEIAQEEEILLSQDFSAMNLEELKKTSDDFIQFARQNQNRKSWTKAQYAAWQYMYFRIKQEENKNDAVKVGDLFYSSWGYEQTNIEFWKVSAISKTGKTCEILQVAAEEIGDERTNTRNMSGEFIPNPDKVVNETPCTVKIERGSSWNPYHQKHEKIGSVQLRGSVYYANGKEKHLQTLSRCTGPKYASWYA